jgi:hypothetical protein
MVEPISAVDESDSMTSKQMIIFMNVVIIITIL